MFWFVTKGDKPNGMPSWATLPKQQRWQIISYIRTLSGEKAAPAAALAPAKAAAPDLLVLMLTVSPLLTAVSLALLGSAVGAFFAGPLADRIGRRPVLFAAIILDAVFGVASAFAPDLQPLS